MQYAILNYGLMMDAGGSCRNPGVPVSVSCADASTPNVTRDNVRLRLRIAAHAARCDGVALHRYLHALVAIRKTLLSLFRYGEAGFVK